MTSVAGSTSIHHINYGTTFSLRGRVGFSDEAWTHSYLIDIGQEIDIPLIPTCANLSSKICKAKNSLVFKLNAARSELSSNLNTIRKLLDNLLPNTDLPIQTMLKSALFGFLGTIIHSMTGLADEDQMRQVEGQIKTLTKAIKAVGGTLMHENDEFSSFVKTVDERLNNAVAGIQQNALETEKLTNEFHRAAENLERLTFITTASVVRELTNIQTITTQHERLTQALSDLAENKLSHLLL
ncbi:MAG: hypothetical protein N0C90_27120, partial [Candidatus Thiodiazotropha endolucinida]|nr:hypothetical protein [Candidatus Thiodiazotropha taylori]MCW4265019.1 hypothetical protein [Candidatus Thiodiazotropha endolucinida]